MKCTINPDYLFLKDFLHSLPFLFSSRGDIIHTGRNILKRYQIGGCNIIVKSFKIPNLINRFAYISIRKSKACRSYKNAKILLAKGINTPIPIAYIENYSWGLNQSFYISLECPYKRDMREFWYKPEIGDRHFILEAFAHFTADMHNKGILHRDYSAGNILFDLDTNNNPVFSLVDINRLKFEIVREKEGYKNFAHLWLSDEAYKIIAYHYASARGFKPDHAIKQICYYKDKFMKSKR